MTFPADRLQIEVAARFGGTRVDLTDRAQQQEITISRGRPDEAGDTASSTVGLVLDNLDGHLTPGDARSPWWPHVRRGVPIRVRAEGDSAALALPGEVGSSASTPDHAAYDVTDLDVRVLIQPDAWSTGARYSAGQLLVGPVQRLAGRWLEAGDERAWSFSLAGAGRPRLSWSTDGTAATVTTETTLRLVAGLRPLWLAAILDTDNGAGGHVLAWWRWDPIDGDPPADVTDWQLIEAITRAGTTSIHPAAAGLTIGERDNDDRPFAGRILELEQRDSINGTLITSPDFAAQAPGTTSFADAQGRTWTLTGDASVSTMRTRITGQAVDWHPMWPHGDNAPLPAGVALADQLAAGGGVTEARVAVTVAGVLRRLSQGRRTQPLRSTLHRHVLLRGGDAVLAYWPCEDSSGAAAVASGLAGGAAAVVGGVELGADSSLPASAPLPQIRSGEDGTWSGVVTTLGDGTWAVEWVFRVPTPPASPDVLPLIQVHTSADARTWRVGINDSALSVEITDPAGAVLQSVAAGISATTFDGWVLARLYASQDGADLDWGWTLVDLDTGVGGGISDTLASTTAGPVGRVSVAATGPEDSLSFGHVIVSDGSLPVGWLAGADTAWVGESAAHRIWRLCAEEDIPAEIIGDPEILTAGLRGTLARSEPMGPQTMAPLLDLLRECEAVDQGILLERRALPGLVYRTGRSLQSQAHVLALDAAAAGRGDIVPPLEPVLDDQRVTNDMTVTARGGSSARVVDQDHIDAEDLYPADLEVAGVGGVAIQAAILASQPGLAQAVGDQCLLVAGWRLALGTWPGMRYPTVTVDLSIAGTAGLLDAWHDVAPGDRVTLVGLPAQHPLATVELLLEGLAETLSPTGWLVELACSPGGPWLAGVLDE